MIRIGLIVPVYKAAQLQPYTLRTLQSFFRATERGLALVMDDASPGWSQPLEAELASSALHRGQETLIHRFETRGGLTRSWNEGLSRLFAHNKSCLPDDRVTHVICGNNDLVFPRGYTGGLLHALECGFHVAGPVSNAPGATSSGLAEVWRYLPEYTVDDDEARLNEISRDLQGRHSGVIVETPVNGFCWVAKTEIWDAGRYDAKHVFKPRNERMPSGRRNPDPLNCGNEDEFQHRARQRGWKSGVAVASFVFHYRSVARGRRHLKGRWHRMSAAPTSDRSKN